MSSLDVEPKITFHSENWLRHAEVFTDLMVCALACAHFVSGPGGVNTGALHQAIEKLKPKGLHADPAAGLGDHEVHWRDWIIQEAVAEGLVRVVDADQGIYSLSGKGFREAPVAAARLAHKGLPLAQAGGLALAQPWEGLSDRMP